MSMSQAVATAAAADDAKVRRVYAAAIARGASNTLCTAEQERAYGTLRLLTLASLRLPDLVLYSHLLEGFADDPGVERVPPVVVGAVRGVAAGALRLAIALGLTIVVPLMAVMLVFAAASSHAQCGGVVAVTTVVPSRSLAVASSYLADLAGETAATHVRLADPGRGRVSVLSCKLTMSV